MPVYSYRAMDPDGKNVRGNMDALNLPDMEMRLKRMDLDLIDCKPMGQKADLFGRRAITRKDLINFCFHMEQMIAAGVPILEGLADLRDSLEHPRFREVVSDVMENIEGGLQFSEALSHHSRIFDTTFVNLIAAGERTGQLSEVMGKLTETLKWQDELASSTKKLATYPAVVGFIVFAVAGFLMTSVVPQLLGFIKSMGQEPPIYTKALIFVSDFIVNYWYLILAAPPVAAIVLAISVKTSPKARYRFDEFKLRLWLVGPILRKIILARFATFFALMYASGITILECMELSEQIAGNEVIKGGLRRARQLISEGQSVTASFQNTGLFPPLVVRMLKVGESTGGLDTAMRNVSYFYDREVKELIENVQKLIEPIMTIIMGSLLLWIMVSVLGPIYDIISKIKT